MDSNPIIQALSLLPLPNLASIVVDLEEAEADWAVYPAAAPAAAARQTLIKLRQQLTQNGIERAAGGRQSFETVLAQVRQARDEEADWQAERNRQDRQNWFEDYQ